MTQKGGIEMVWTWFHLIYTAKATENNVAHICRCRVSIFISLHSRPRDRQSTALQSGLEDVAESTPVHLTKAEGGRSGATREIKKTGKGRT